MISTELKGHFAKVRILGQGADRISLSASEIAWLLYLTAGDLGLKATSPLLKAVKKHVPQFYDIQIPPMLPERWKALTTDELLSELDGLITGKPMSDCTSAICARRSRSPYQETRRIAA